jgi:hypothetical protein
MPGVLIVNRHFCLYELHSAQQMPNDVAFGDSHHCSGLIGGGFCQIPGR